VLKQQFTFGFAFLLAFRAKTVTLRDIPICYKNASFSKRSLRRSFSTVSWAPQPGFPKPEGAAKEHLNYSTSVKKDRV
jgi:hypothetical protein